MQQPTAGADMSSLGDRFKVGTAVRHRHGFDLRLRESQDASVWTPGPGPPPPPRVRVCNPPCLSRSPPLCFPAKSRGGRRALFPVHVWLVHLRATRPCPTNRLSTGEAKMRQRTTCTPRPCGLCTASWWRAPSHAPSLTPWRQCTNVQRKAFSRQSSVCFRGSGRDVFPLSVEASGRNES